MTHTLPQSALAALAAAGCRPERPVVAATIRYKPKRPSKFPSGRLTFQRKRILRRAVGAVKEGT